MVGYFDFAFWILLFLCHVLPPIRGQTYLDQNGYIGASKSYTPIDPIQHRCKVCLSDVVIADFGFVQGDSRGNPIYHAWGIPCLNLFLSDDSMERIVLCGYSMEQIKQIEEALLEENRDILFDHKSDVFKWN